MLKKQEPKEVSSLSNVTFSYNGRPVLKDVNMVVEQGDFLALIGPNGSAKSTLMKIMVGLLKPKKGEVRLFGNDIRYFNDWDRVGYISQNASNINTSFPATVEEVVASGYYTGFGRLFEYKKKKEATRSVLKLVGISDISGSLIGQLSGGQRQKVFLAKALVKQPEVLFLDEPTTGFDARFQGDFYKLLLSLNKSQGITVVIITHDIGAALDTAKKIGCVKGSKVYIHKDIDEVTEGHIAEVLGYKIVKG